MSRAAAIFVAVILLVSASARAQTGSATTGQKAAEAPPAQEQCITILYGFPANNPGARYQLFRLTQKLAIDATPGFRAALARYGSASVNAKIPITEVIRGIANPVLRQAEPELVIGQIAYLIDFSRACEAIITGQIESLRAFDPDLKKRSFNSTIDKDTLFLRQILSNALRRLKAHQDQQYGDSVQAYDRALISTRDQIEYKTFNSDVGDLESLYMTDLDKRLARSNDLANQEMDREVLSNAVETSKNMTQNNQKQEKKRSLITLINILGGL